MLRVFEKVLAPVRSQLTDDAGVDAFDDPVALRELLQGLLGLGGSQSAAPSSSYKVFTPKLTGSAMFRAAPEFHPVLCLGPVTVAAQGVQEVHAEPVQHLPVEVVLRLEPRQGKGGHKRPQEAAPAAPNPKSKRTSAL